MPGRVDILFNSCCVSAINEIYVSGSAHFLNEFLNLLIKTIDRFGRNFLDFKKTLFVDDDCLVVRREEYGNPFAAVCVKNESASGVLA